MNDKKVVVHGAGGNMGKAICWALKQQGYRVLGVDIDRPDKDKNIDTAYSSVAAIGSTYDLDLRDHTVSAIISAMPYFNNTDAAVQAMEWNIPYIDLGGHIETSATINALAKKRGATVATDQGLAPGWVNIVAEQMYDRCIARRPDHHVKSVVMLCGGIPERYSTKSVFNYRKTWSADGLLNEYKDDCFVLKGGEVFKAPGMSGLGELSSPWDEGQNVMYECFRTSGGASHTIESMRRKGVCECEYKTVRWPRHHQVMSLLIKAGLSPADIVDVLDAEPSPYEDKVVFYVQADREVYRGNIAASGGFSAMQKATAFPASVVVSLIAQGKLSGIVDYEKIGTTHYQEFDQTVTNLLTEADKL